MRPGAPTAAADLAAAVATVDELLQRRVLALVPDEQLEALSEEQRTRAKRKCSSWIGTFRYAAAKSAFTRAGRWPC